MKAKIKKVYYCDYCGRHSLRPLTSHELHCTMNPNRECRLCGRTESLTPVIEKWKKIAEKILKEKEKFKDGIPGEIYKGLEDKIHFSKIQEDLTVSCPICTFSIIRLVGLNHFPFETKFELEKEVKEWWEKKNADENPY